ncbi:MAG: hypothetical protein M3R08_01225 [Bacteroidota bacterium]|nr:hypothetical protein [Bacteroidota bacterium]
MIARTLGTIFMFCVLQNIEANSLLIDLDQEFGMHTPAQGRLDHQDTLQIKGDRTAKMDAAWKKLEAARKLHVKGKGKAALQILEALIRDTAIIDQEFIQSRRELSAFVLASSGEYQRASDTLRSIASSRIDAIEGEFVSARSIQFQQLDSLNDELSDHRKNFKTTIREFETRQDDRFFLFVAVVLLLLILIVIVGIRPKPSRRPEMVKPETAVVTEVRPEIKEPDRSIDIPRPIPGIKLAEPLDPIIMLAHADHISKQLNKGDTVEAAGHLGILTRFLKILVDNSAGGKFLPAQQALALYRQYLKLEVLRIGSKVRYTVDADRALLDRDVPFPGISMLRIFSAALQEIGSRDNATLSVKIGTGENVIQCVITGVDHQLLEVGDPDIVVRHEVLDQQAKIIVEWPALGNDPATRPV